MLFRSDSTIDHKCLKNSARYFLDKSIVATASNVRIVGNGTIIGLAQKYEYLISHHMKRTAAIGIVAKKPDQFGKAMLFPAMVETYAILALLIFHFICYGYQNLV